MLGQDFSKIQRKRLNPFKGLVIDVPIWVDAHNYHRDQLKLHAMTLHEHGIVAGLEVLAWNPPDNTVVIHPGVAMDSEGNMIVVLSPQRLNVNTGEKGTSRIVIEYSEIAQDRKNIPGESKEQPLYLMEAFRIEEQRQRPDESCLELARIITGGKGAPIKDASDHSNPAPNEIDMRYRLAAGSRSKGYVGLGVLNTPGWMCHQEGILNLVKSANHNTDCHIRFKGAVDLADETSGYDLLYLCGTEDFQLKKDQENVLSRFLDRGGVLLGEACSEGGPQTKEQTKTFRQSFAGLAQRLGRRLKSVERGHPLLKAHYIFSSVPAGLDGPTLMVEDQGMLYSDGDFGCIWAGGKADKAASRETIRDAIELGINIAVYAYERTRYNALNLLVK